MPAIDGLEAFLDGQAHRRLAVASSSERAWLDTMLGRLGLAGFFGEHVYSAARIPRGKPHPDVYLHVDEQLRLPSSACLVIEDHPVEIGRPSCRDRVCPYVLIPVAAGTLKKK